MAARNLQPPFPLRRTALALALRQVLQQRRWQALVAAGMVGLAPASLGDPFPADLPLSSLDGTNGFKLSGVAADDLSGFSVSNAGDVNGDGTDDLLIGAFGADPNGYASGASYVVFGGSGVGGTGTFELSMLDGSNGFKLSGVAANDISGRSVSAAGDVNGDGVDDILIGAFGAGLLSGASYVVFGGSGVGGTGTIELSILDGTNGFKLSGAAGDGSGVSVSNAGDVNGDGTDDILIGAPFAAPNGSQSGASYVVFGEGSGVTCQGLAATIVGSAAGETLTGTAGADVIQGLGGDDTIIGGGGDDVICGGAGDDTLSGNAGADQLDGGEGANDRCNGGPGSDTATGCETVRGVP